MEKRIFYTLIFALGALLLGASVSHAQSTLFMPGSFQVANGGSLDWDPPSAPAMTEIPPSSGIHELALSGLTGAVAGTPFLFKILDDEGSGSVTWSSPELTPTDSWFFTDATGSSTISIDTNTFADDFLPATNRVTVSTDSEISLLAPTGSWVEEAGGLANWDPAETTFAMTDQGSGLWSVDATIASPGTYEFKMVADGDTNGWAYQWGGDGRNVNASNVQFFTVAANQDVTFELDLSKGAIRFDTETFKLGDTNNNGVIELEPDFGPIRDNWLTETFLREEGNLDNTGDSEGIIDIADFRQWKNAWNGPPEAVAAAFASLGAVPEPGSAVLAAFAMTLIAGMRRRRG